MFESREAETLIEHTPMRQQCEQELRHCWRVFNPQKPMALRRYKMAATISSTGNNQDSFTAQRAGTIKQIHFNCLFDCITDNAALRTQVARTAVSDLGAGAGVLSGCLAQFFQQSNLLTSGVGQPPGNWAVDCNDRISVGEQLFINSVVTGTISAALEVVLVVEESGS